MKLEKGKNAETKSGMKHNVKVMERAGYSKKRSEGAAYGEVGMAKKARRDESKGAKKHDDRKEDEALIRKEVKKMALKKAAK